MTSFSAGDIEGAEDAIETISNLGERQIFSEVGKITRNLHSALNGLKNLVDPRLKSIAEDEMPEATDKLEYVINKLDGSSHKTINIVEKYLSSQPKMIEAIEGIALSLNGNGSEDDEQPIVVLV